MLIQPTVQPPIARIRWDDVIAASALAGAAAFAGVEWLCWGPHTWSTHCALTLKTIANLVGGWFQADADRYVIWLQADWTRLIRFDASLVGPLFAAGWVGIDMAKPRSPEIHVRGRRVKAGAAGAAKAIANQNPKGIFLHPEIRISHDQETKHFMISGGTGAGKTIVVSHILQEAIARNDRVLVVDYKGLRTHAERQRHHRADGRTLARMGDQP